MKQKDDIVSGNKPDKGYEILVLNLDKSRDRLAFQQRQLASLKVPMTRISAIPGEQVSDEQFAKLGRKWQRPMTRNEVACLLTHSIAWRRCVDRNYPILVLEDDAILSEQLPAAMLEIVALKGVGSVNLETRNAALIISKMKEETAITDSVSLYKVFLDRGGGAGYVLFPEAAKELLGQMDKHPAVADIMLRRQGKFRQLHTDPGLVVAIDCLGNFGVDPGIQAETTITYSHRTRAFKIKQLILHPAYKFRRLANWRREIFRKLTVASVSVTRAIEACSSIIESPKRIQKLWHG